MKIDFKKSKRISFGYKKGFDVLPDADKMSVPIMFKVKASDKHLIDEACKIKNITQSDLIREYVSYGLRNFLSNNQQLF